MGRPVVVLPIHLGGDKTLDKFPSLGERYARARCRLWRLPVKITSVETLLLRFPVDPDRYGASSKGWIRDRSSLLVRVKTDAGVEGWGEGGQEPLLEFDRNPSPLRDELSLEPIRFEHGVVQVPQGPGLGIAINLEVLGRYRVA